MSLSQSYHCSLLLWKSSSTAGSIRVIDKILHHGKWRNIPNSHSVRRYLWKYCLGNDDIIPLTLCYGSVFVPYFYHVSELILTASCFYLPFRDGESGAEAHQKPEMRASSDFKGKDVPEWLNQCHECSNIISGNPSVVILGITQNAPFSIWKRRRWWNHILRLKLEARIFVLIISFPLCNFWGFAWRSLPSQQALVSPLKALLFLNLFALKENMNSYYPLLQSPGNIQHLARANIWRTFLVVTGCFKGCLHVPVPCWKLINCDPRTASTYTLQNCIQKSIWYVYAYIAVIWITVWFRYFFPEEYSI